MFSSQTFIKSILFKLNKVNVVHKATKVKSAKLKKHEHDLNLRNEYKLQIDAILKDFLADSSQKEYKFSSLLNLKEREYVHMMAIRHGLTSKSHRGGSNRYISLFKEDSKTESKMWDLTLKRETAQTIFDILKRYPVTESEMEQLESVSRKSDAAIFDDSVDLLDLLSFLSPRVPPKINTNNQLYLNRQKLPIWQYQDQLINLLNSNQVILVSGDTGCGKTTQVPQFILDHCTSTNTQCRVIVAEPRRIAATSVAERVARERGELLGQTVGYHIRFDNMTSSETCLTFCTNGILLRKLMQRTNSLNGITHIIIDEAHERDHKCDFLLLSLFDLLPQNPNLKLIIMSATLDNERFSTYFSNCPTLTVPGIKYDVKSYFLEDVLKMTNWENNIKLNQQPFLKRKNEKKNYSSLMSSMNLKSLISDEVNDHDLKSTEGQKLLELYHQHFDDELVDFNLIIDLISYIIKNEDNEKNSKGAILVFLPGFDDITNLRDMITSNRKIPQDSYQLFFLHSQIQNDDQRKVFDSISPQKRKIILSTNVAETSVTINDVVYVIDSGKVKEKSYDNFLGSSMLNSVWISQSSAIQRRGRAGRCQNGICYHLFSRLKFESMKKNTVPEILRMPIHELCLQAKLLAPKYSSLKDFLQKSLDPPSEAAVETSIQLLKTIEALDQNEQLTKLGYHLLNLPIDPKLGKMILSSIVLKCLDPILILASTLSCQNPFIIPLDSIAKKDAKMIRKDFTSDSYSDHFMYIKAFQGWKQACRDGHPRLFSQNNFLRNSTMHMIDGVLFQLLNQLKTVGFIKANGPGDIYDLNQNSDKWPVIKAALCSGCYPQVIKICPDSQKLITHKEKSVRIHPSSALNANSFSSKRRKAFFSSLPLNWIIFEEMIGIGSSSFARVCSLVSSVSVLLIAGQAQSEKSNLSSDQESIRLDDLVQFKTNSILGPLAINIRKKYQILFLRRLEMYQDPPSIMDEEVLKAIVKILVNEEPNESANLLESNFGPLISIDYLKRSKLNSKRFLSIVE